MSLLEFFRLGVTVTAHANGSAILDSMERFERPSAPLQLFLAGIASGYYAEDSKELLAALGPEAGALPLDAQD